MIGYKAQCGNLLKTAIHREVIIMWKRILSVTAVLSFVGTASAIGQDAKSIKPYVPKSYKSAIWGKPVEIEEAKVVKSPSVSLKDEKGYVGNIQAALVSAAKWGTDTLSYDDGTPEFAMVFSNAGNGWGVKFTPAQYPVNIDGALIYFVTNGTIPGGNLINLWIMDDDGENGAPQTVLYSAEGITITMGDWNYIELPTQITITEGSFYVFYIQHDDYPNCPALAVDMSPSPPGTQWEYLNGTYIDDITDYVWMIRAVVSLTSDSLDPLPPSDVTAYSDYTMPTEINLSWVDPTHYVGGDTLTDFHIEIWMSSEGQDSVFLDTAPAGMQQYMVTGLRDGTLYTFFLRTVDINDSASIFDTVSRYAGGSPYPAPPHDLAATALDDSTVELTWINPSTQADGTPLDDLAGINIYVNGELAETYETSDTGALITYDITVTHGRHTFYVTAFDNESPQHESNPSNEVEVITNVHAGGPDGYGYTFTDSDYPNGPAFDWIDASAGTPHNLGDDNILIQLPFAFPFYDQTLTEIYLVSDGFFSSTNTRDPDNDPLPNNAKDNIIAPFWDDLNPGSGGTIYTYFDTTNHIFVVEWYQVPHFGSGGPYTFEVIFYPNGDLKFQYLDMDENLVNSSTIGIQGGDGSNDFYLQYTYNGNPLTVHDSLAVYWIHPPINHDVAVVSIAEPNGNYGIGDTIIPVASVVNNGSASETFDMIAKIYHEDTLLYTSTVTVTADTGEAVDATFDDFTVSSYGLYHFVVYAALEGDENPHNDTLDCYFSGADYTENFESTNGGFTPNPSTGAWEWGTPTYGPPTPHSGRNLWGTLLAGNYRNRANWELYSVDYIATSDNPTFTFWQWYDIDGGYDGGNVAVSIDNGTTWTIVEPVGGYDGNSINGLGGEPGFTGNSGGWVQAVFHLDGITAGTLFRIRFRFGSDWGTARAGWYIDDVTGVGFMSLLEVDVGVTDVISPVGQVLPGVPVDVSATVRNYEAIDAIFDVTAIIYTESEDTVFNRTINLRLGAMDSIDVSFGLFRPGANTDYNIVVSTSLTGDENASNDTAYAQFSTILRFGDVTYVLDAQTVTGDYNLFGIEFDGNYFYITGANSGRIPNKLYVLDPTGTLLCAIDQPDHSTGWGWRDLAFDGDTLYASVDPNVDAFSIDVGTCQLTYYGSFAGPENPNWALAYRPSDRHFFTANFESNIYEFDKTNPSINTWPNNYAIYGAAYNPLTQTVWFSTWEMNSYGYRNVIYEFDPATGSYTGNTIEFPLPEGYTDAVAGGLSIHESNGALVMFELLQGDPNDLIVGIYMGFPSVEEEPVKPTTYSLNIKQNPIYRSGVLSFTLPKPSDVEIALYDATGRMVSKLAYGNFFAGSHTVTLNASNLANGVYFVHMKADNFKTVKRVIVLR